MEIGKKLNGRYKIIGAIGGGGMANVFLAHDLILDRDVAVKVLRYDFRDDQDTIRRFKREALSATELVHPNIVSVYDIGEEDSNQYIVMEYVKGMDLKEYIYHHFPIPYQKVLDIMEQVLSAVADAHRHRIIHRDLKPQNILIDNDGTVKITDFGIAVALSQTSITQTNSLLGSVHYLSPEQARGGMATKQSDIYSLGVILYELLTRNVPFEGESAVSIALKHFQEPLPSVRDFDHRIPQALENVVLKATAKEATDRYESAHEMAADLETSLSQQRLNEPRFEPASMTGATKVLEPIGAIGSMEASETGLVPEAEEVQQSEQEDDREETSKKKKKPPKTKKKRKKWLWIILGLLLLAGIGGAVILALNTPQEVVVTDVSGLTQSQAVEALVEDGLTLGEVILEADEDIEEGYAIRTDPESGSTLLEGAEVDLFVSSGRETVDFGDYRGESYDAIRAELTEQGFTVRSSEESSDTVPEGSIISQSIEEGEPVIPSETTVEFTVSTGQAGFAMRDLSGYSRASIQDYADDNSLSVTITEDYSDEVPQGQVITQTPDAGETLYRGDSISVVISLGPEEIPIETFTETITIPYEPADETDTSEDGETVITPNSIEIYIEDEENSFNSVYQQLEITEDTEVTLEFTLQEGDTGSYRVVRDGEVIAEETNVSP